MQKDPHTVYGTSYGNSIMHQKEKAENHLYQTVSGAETTFRRKKAEITFRPTNAQMQKHYSSVFPRNETDMHFLECMEECRRRKAGSMVQYMKNSLFILQQDNPALYNDILCFYRKHSHLGRLEPQSEDYSAFWMRAQLLQNYRSKVIRLYSLLADYRSKRTLCALLENWMHLETVPLQTVKDHSLQIFDQDFMPDAHGKKMVNLWASEGNDIRNFIKAYGDVYDQIVCYTHTQEDALKLTCGLRGIKRLQIFTSGDGTPNIDRDIPGPIDFIRLHGEGNELQLLDCCSAQLAAYRPSLIVSACFGYDAVFEIPERILRINPSYRIYLRYFGDTTAASDYYLIAI